MNNYGMIRQYERNCETIRDNIDGYLEKLSGLYVLKKIMIDTDFSERDIKIVNRKIRYYERQVKGSENAIGLLEKRIEEMR